jgi:hypothetical protein
VSVPGADGGDTAALAGRGVVVRGVSGVPAGEGLGVAGQVGGQCSGVAALDEADAGGRVVHRSESNGHLARSGPGRACPPAWPRGVTVRSPGERVSKWTAVSTSATADGPLEGVPVLALRVYRMRMFTSCAVTLYS